MKPLRNNQTQADGFTALEMIVVIAVVVLLVVLVVPRMARPKVYRSYSSCLSNLKQIGLAARMFSNDHNEKFPWQLSTATNGTLELVNGPTVAPHFIVMSNELNTPKILACGADTNRTRTIHFSEFGETNLSYFVGLDADETKPLTILSGDRNVTGGNRVTNRVHHFAKGAVAGFTKDMHNQVGNLGFGDGSSMQVSPAALKRAFDDAILSSGQPAVRLAIP